jgi:hypothetical protein
MIEKSSCYVGLKPCNLTNSSSHNCLREFNYARRIKGASNNSILFPNLGFFPATALPKYSFSDAKLCFWGLVSEKNTYVGIPKGINRGPLNKKKHANNKEFPNLVWLGCIYD